jgi:type II secretory pathway pseudopilin PulG
MKQAENSYTSLKKDFEEDYRKHKNVFNVIVGAFIVGLIASVVFLFWGMSRGVSEVDYNHRDSEVRDLMWSMQEALDTYYKQNQSYPSDIRDLEIRHSDDTYKVISSNEVEYMDYKISYSETNNKDYKIETYLKGPAIGGKYILYNDKR